MPAQHIADECVWTRWRPRYSQIPASGASDTLSDEQKARISAKVGPRVTAVAQDARSQARNRELALERLRDRLSGALMVQRPRRATRPTKASTRRRLDSKRQQSERKQGRRRLGQDE